jgi:excisionase family DNA binding protein
LVLGALCRSEVGMAMIGTTEAARRLGVSRRRVSAMVTQGLLKAQKIGKTLVVDEAEVDRLSKLDRPTGRPKKE